ncbi:phage tail tape measure protein [Vibrio fluvialis]|nr:phage tail tape measure protein [Vibrio fluvialis]
MLEKLMMVVGLNDQVSKPLGGIMKQVDGAMNTAKSGMQNMATGGAGLVATGFAIQSALMPAIEMDRKVGEVKSLGVTDEALKQLSKTALDFSGTYGKSATEFVGAAYDIKSAMGDLDGDSLASITKSSGILAAATKADTATITSYMGTMYSVFQQQADATEGGVSKWVEQVAGMTAKSVELFKTTGQGMSDAFKGVGAIATKNGVAIQEQMAVLGMLQGSMSGGEAGTKYRAFINGAIKAQKGLGLSFTDSNGKLLPMYDILEKIKGKFGDLDSKEMARITKAFGSDQATMVIADLLDKTEQLGDNMQKLQTYAKLETAEKMASAMTDQWERLEASWFAIRAAAFGMVLPSFNAIAGSISDGLLWLTAMTDQYPLLTQVMGYASIIAVSFGGFVAALSLAMGAAQFMTAGWGLTIKLLGFAMKASRLLTIAWSAAVMIANGDFALMRVILTGTIARVWAWAAATRAGQATTIAWAIATKAFAVSTAFLKGGFTALTASTWLFNAALWANPITWVVAGIAALVIAVGAMIYWWDDLKASFGDTAVFKMLAATIDWVIDKLNMIPGIDIEWRAGEMPQMPQTESVTKTLSHVSAGDMPTFSQPPTESLFNYTSSATEPMLSQNMVKNMNSTQSRETSHVRQYGDVYITTQGGFTPDELAEWDELNAG